MIRIQKYAFITILGLLLSACSGGKNQTNIELVQNMFDQPSLKSQDYDLENNQIANRVPPEGTVARGKPPYKYKTDPIAAEANLKNPISADDVEALARGKQKFEIYCALCHGHQGNGDGQIAEYMALKPPPLVSDKVKAFKDGRIFHIITAGQGVMGSYASQIQKEQDRWAIVNYVRTLQK